MRKFVLNANIIKMSLICALAIAGCNSAEQEYVNDNTPVSEIFDRAQTELNRGRGTEAGDLLMEVERLHPFTPEAAQALILAAQAYHDDGALTESRIAAQRYLQYFPGSPQAPLAAYLVALSYYDGIVDVTRDQSRTFEALQALQVVIDEYPNTEYADLARPKFNTALNQLAGKEMEIGRYYLSQDYFAAAAGRFKAVIDEYPANTNTPEAYHRLVETYLRMGLRGEAVAAYSKLQAAYPDSNWTKRSDQLLSTGEQPNAGVTAWDRLFTGGGI